MPPTTAAEFPDTGHARNYAQTAYEYAQAAAADRYGRTHCRWVRLAAKRFLKDLSAKKLPFFFDPWHANNACDFIEKLPHVKGVWDSPTIVLEPVQCFILANIFGWRHPVTNVRRFQMVYLEMARKGAKSTLAAGIGLYCLTCENEVGPDIVIGATTGAQADKVFLPAKQMVDKTEALRDWKGLQTFRRSITCDQNGGSIQPINSKSSTQDGWNPHAGILDELHAHKDRGLFDVIRSAFGSRKNPLMLVITTAGYNAQGVCYEQRTALTKVLDGKIAGHHIFGVIFTLDKKDNPYDESKWIKANPMLGITPTVESMRTYAEEAQASPGVAYEFKTKRLNIWTTAKDAWLNMAYWDKCPKAKPLAEFRHLPCYGGIDLASTTDVAAFVLAFIDGEDIYVRPRFYLPEDNVLEHADRRSLPYPEWKEKGYITTTPGNRIDYAFIQKDITDALDEFDVQMIGYDPWNATQLVNNLQEKEAPLVLVRQGPISLNDPMKRLESAMRGGTLHHGHNPVLSWMASNVVARFDPNMNMAPDKKNSEEKIDGIVALLNALHASAVEVDPEFNALAAIG